MSETLLFDYWRSSASYRVRIALNLAGIDYETTSIDLVSGAQKAARYLEQNPQGLVPTLLIDGHRLTQSLAIIEYLDQTGDLGLLPADPLKRANVQAAAHAIAIDIHPVCNLSVMKHATGGREPARSNWMQHFITPGLRAFEQLIAPHAGTYSFGDTPSLADLCLIPQLYNADRWGTSYADSPNIRRVAQTCTENPAFAAAHPDRVKPA